MFARSVLSRSVGPSARLARIRVPAARMQHVIVMAAAAEGKKLYVGNLAWAASTNDLYTLFSKYGEVSDAFIPTDRQTGRPRGFAFVTMIDADGAEAAVAELNGVEFQGRELRVNEAAPQGERPAGGRGRGGYRNERRGGGGGRGGYRSERSNPGYDYETY